MIEIKDLCVEFETEKGMLKALRGVDFQVHPGDSRNCRRVRFRKKCNSDIYDGIVAETCNKKR